ncbi:MAG TPA: TadE/TadG family type IV pilus assembly protein [Dongiaceae bacterium]|nr:TadE/TadG family type IV pilus assembly protein [Dongiaceae bacterium]
MWQDRKEQDTISDRQRPLARIRVASLRRLWREQGGTTAIEFSFIALGLIYFMFGIIEFAMAMTVGNSLEAATNLSSRLGKTGYVVEDETQEQTIRDEIERRVGPLIDMTKLTITNQVYNDFSSLTNPDILEDQNADGDTDDPGEWTDVDGDGFKDGAGGVGKAGEIVVYKIMYPWSVITPFMGKLIGDNGVLNLVAYSVVKNEPY